MKKIGILTLGCRVNQYESDAVSEALEKKGYSVGDIEKGCDAYIINTCTVTAESDAKCRKAIRRAARLRDESGGVLIVMGCFAQGAKQGGVLDLADFVIGNGRKMTVSEKIEKIIEKTEHGGVESIAGADFEKMEITHCRHAKAYVKIEDGCNNFCTYCFVPYVRGRVRSRKKEDIISEIRQLEDKGYTEIILTGIETASYGEEWGEKEVLISLIEEISDSTSVSRLRLGSMYPSFFTRERCRRLAALPCVMPHFHLSVQSGSDDVLKNMRRGYTRQELYEAVANIREFIPDASLSCDMICGFPQESEENFTDSLKFIEECEILHAHIFPYSKRQGTSAAGFSGQIPENIKHDRAKKMAESAVSVSGKVLEKYLGKPCRVLVEQVKGDCIFGYTEHFIHVCAKSVRASVGEIVSLNLKKEHIFSSEDTESSQK